MREDWLECEAELLGNLIRGINYKKTQSSDSKQKGYLPILRANNIRGNSLNFDDLKYVEQDLVKSEQRILRGDIVFAMSSGSKHLVGKSGQAQSDYKGSFGAFCSVFRPNKNIDQNFIQFYFHSGAFRRIISNASKGSNINNLKREHVLNAIIPIPSLSEQRAIVCKIEELFSELDKGVAELKKAQDQLKVYRQAVLKKAFEGELTNVNMIVKKLSDECEIIMGQSPPGSSYNQEGIGTPLINGPVEFGEGPLGKTVKSKWTTKPTKLCKKGDLILCVRGSTTGKTNIANFEACVGRGVAAIRFNSNQEYLNSYMLFKRYEVFTKGTGTTFPSVSSKELREFDFPICSQEEQHQIVQEIESRLSVCDKVKDSINESLEKAEALRQSILKKAFEGSLLSTQEIEKCKAAPDYEPAAVLLEKIKSS